MISSSMCLSGAARLTTWICLLTVIACKDGLVVSQPAKDVVYFPNTTAGSSWLGRPVSQDKDGIIQPHDWAAGTNWADACKTDVSATDLANIGQSIQTSFDAAALIDAIRSEARGEFWRNVRENKIALSDPLIDKTAFCGLLEAEHKGDCETLWNVIRNPFRAEEFNPGSNVGFSVNKALIGANARVTDQLQAGFEAETATLNLWVVSQWGQLRLNNGVRACLRREASKLSPKPQYLVDSLTIGVLFEYQVTATDVKASATGTTGQDVSIEGKVNYSRFDLKGVLRGEVDPSPQLESLSSIVGGAAGNDNLDKTLLEYFATFANSVKTPVYVAGHMDRL